MKRMQIRHSIVKDKAGYRRTCAAPNFGGKKCNDVMPPDVPAHRGLFALYDRRNKALYCTAQLEVANDEMNARRFIL